METVINQHPIRKIYTENLESERNIKANHPKMNLMIPSTSYSKPKTATMIRKDLWVVYVNIQEIVFKIYNTCDYMNITIFPYSVSNIPN